MASLPAEDIPVFVLDSIPSTPSRRRSTHWSPDARRATTTLLRSSSHQPLAATLSQLDDGLVGYALEASAPLPQAGPVVESDWISHRGGALLTRAGRIAAVLAAGYPSRGLDQLVADLDAAGLDVPDLLEHQAVAATQAAVWHLSSGFELHRDTEAAVRLLYELLLNTTARPIASVRAAVLRGPRVTLVALVEASLPVRPG